MGGGLAKLDGVWRLCPDFPLNVCRQLVSDMEAIPREKPPAAGARPAAQQQQPPLSLQRLCRFVHCWLGLTQGLLAAHAAVPELREAANGTGGAAAEVGRLVDRCFGPHGVAIPQFDADAGSNGRCQRTAPTQPLKSQREAEDELPQPQPSPLRALISSAAQVARRALSGVAVRSASPAQVAPATMEMDGRGITVRRRRLAFGDPTSEATLPTERVGLPVCSICVR